MGTYKYNLGSNTCIQCPVGTNCDNIGIDLPCVSPGYWRDISSITADASDFSTYPAHSCDLKDSCLGTCGLNLPCASSSLSDSPTCAICADGYFRFYSTCQRCHKGSSGTNKSTLTGFYCLFVIALVAMAVYFIRHRIKAHKKKEVKEAVRSVVARSIVMTIKLVLSFLQVLTGTSTDSSFLF